MWRSGSSAHNSSILQMLAVLALLGLVSVMSWSGVLWNTTVQQDSQDIHEATSRTEVRELFSYWEKEVNCDNVRTSDLDRGASALSALPFRLFGHFRGH